MTRKDFDKWIVAVHDETELKEVLELLEVPNKTDLKNFPMIIYQGQYQSIQLSEIEQKKLEKLGRERLERKVLWNYSDIKSGLAERMEK